MSRIAFGFRVKSGYAVAIALRGPADAPAVVARRIVQLSDPKSAATKQPYHHGLFTHETDRREIARRITAVERCARRSVDELLGDPSLGTCRQAALVVGSLIDPDTVGNPHIRAHASEGALFRRVLADALAAHGIRCEAVVEKQLADAARARLKRRRADITRVVAQFGRSVGGPWRAEEKAASIAAWMTLQR